MKMYFIPALLICILTFCVFRLIYIRRSNAATRISLIITGFILAIPAVLFTSNYTLLIPYAPWFYYFHALPGIEMSSGLTGALLGVLYASSKLRPGKLNAPILTACTMIFLGLLIAPFAKQMIYGINYSILENRWHDGICLQSSSYTCVPACITTLIRMQGGHITEPELASAAGSTSRGTEMWYMMRALRKPGYELRVHHVNPIQKAPVPSVIGVKLGDIGHVVVLLAKDKDGPVIGEPLRGRHKYTWKVFRKSYHPDGTCITISKI